MTSPGFADRLGSPVFDPLSDLFVAQFARPPGLRGVNFRVLSPFQRALLVIDGTVTKFIEASMLEPVVVSLVSQDRRRLAQADEWLEVEAGGSVVARQVVLEGGHTGTLYALAASMVAEERLPEGAKRRLRDHPGGLGRVLVEERMETHREILWYGRERVEPDELPAQARGRTDGNFITRAYRIIYQGRPLMVINEKFPSSPEAGPAHH